MQALPAPMLDMELAYHLESSIL